MPKETQPRPFSDTQKAYRQGVEHLILKTPGIAMEDELLWQESSRGDTVDVPDAFLVDISGGGKRGRFRIELPLSVPINKNELPKSAREQNIAQVWIFGDNTSKEVSEYFGISEDRTRKIIKRSTKYFLKFISHGRYELDSLNFKKPLSDSSKNNLSISRGGLTFRIKTAVEKGAGFKDLRQAGFTRHEIAYARKVLAARHDPVIVPRERSSRKVV